MSLAADRLTLQRVVDPRTDLNSAERRTYQVFDGARDVGYVRVYPDGGVNSTSMTFTANPPSAKVFVNRRPLLSMTFRVTLTGTAMNASGLLQAAGLPTAAGVSAGTGCFDAPRAYPLASAMTSLQVSMNNDRLSQNINQYFRATTRYANPVAQQNGSQSLTPSMLDQSQAYSDLDGYNFSPLRRYGDNVLQTPRGGWSQCLITRNDTTQAPGDTAIVFLTCTEQLHLSPFLSEEGDQSTGFFGLNNMSLTVTLGGRGIGSLAGLASSIWSHSTGGSVLTSAVAEVTEASICFSYLTPDEVQSIPRINNYSYHEPTVYPTTSVSTVAAGASAQLQMNNVQLNSIPSRIFVFASPVDSSVNITSTDTYYRLDGVNISFDNRDAILSNATSYDLYAIAQKNGYNGSWESWRNRVGGVLALDFGEDIPLRTLQSVGSRGSYNLRMTVNVTNIGSATSVPTLTVLVVQEGVLTIADGNVTRSVGLLSEQDVLSTKEMPAMPYHASGSLYGGSWASFWQSAKNFAQKYGRPAIEIAKKIAPAFGPEAVPIVSAIDQGARALGFGLQGGRRISRQQLSKMLH